tara:strand:- start:155 stop:280 length:126 start_codon:yes stop_codon:yes gene_type:complete
MKEYKKRKVYTLQTTRVTEKLPLRSLLPLTATATFYDKADK